MLKHTVLNLRPKILPRLWLMLLSPLDWMTVMLCKWVLPCSFTDVQNAAVWLFTCTHKHEHVFHHCRFMPVAAWISALILNLFCCYPTIPYEPNKHVLDWEEKYTGLVLLYEFVILSPSSIFHLFTWPKGIISCRSHSSTVGGDNALQTLAPFL